MTHSPATGLVIARDLVRVSHTDREKSPDDQHADHARSAERMGWELQGPSYRDLGSASRFATKDREDFERLVADLEAGTFGASILMMWENSRGSRKESEWLRLIELAEARGVRFWIDVRGRLMDPADPHDRRDLVHAAADAAFEAGLLSVRTRRGTAGAARAGLPHGRVLTGYQRVYNEHTRKFEAQIPHPEEGPLITELFDRVDRGHTQRSIAMDWERRGITDRRGKPYPPDALKTLLTNEAYIGVRIHDPGRKPGSRRLSPLAERAPGAWPALVDPAVFWRVQKRLRDNAALTARPGGTKHLLSGLGVCHVCGSLIRRRAGRRYPSRPGYAAPVTYACSAAGGCARVPLAELDQLVTAVALAYLADERNYDAFRQAQEGHAAELEQIAAELAEIARDLEELLTERDAGRIKPASAARGEAAFEQRAEKLRAREAELLRPAELAGLIEPGPDVAARWKAATFDTHRATLRVLLRTEHLGQLRILPIGRGNGKAPVRDRIHLCRGEECRTGPCAA
ncbi:recombinase family protein [Amycolatopsis sp. NPDC051371]|uniref:recombinase family protein n=1 Tax=Amycolatopsis sp. NPDC051371 TaxID=3155800 RepID=UPI003448B670